MTLFNIDLIELVLKLILNTVKFDLVMVVYSSQTLKYISLFLDIVPL